MQINSKVTLLLRFFQVWFQSALFYIFPSLKKEKDVSRKVVLITGGGSGLGRLLATRFADLGSKVVIWDISESGLEETKKLIKKQNGYCKSYLCDVSDRSYVYTTAEKVMSEVGPVDILINNAGIVSGRDFNSLNDESVVRTFQVNALAPFWTCKAFLPYMLENNSGHIVTISSVAGLVGTPSLSDYCASKSACFGLHETLWLESKLTKPNDIHFTLICPFFMNTGMFEGVQTGLIPMVEPAFAADEIVRAVLTNEEFLFIPKVFTMLNILKAIIPYRALVVLFQLLDADTSMKNFVGRHGISGTGVGKPQLVNNAKGRQ